MTRSLFLFGMAVCLIAGTCLADAPTVRFGREIRPLLSENCVQCHGPDDEQRQADLRLDVEHSALASRNGHAAIVPGDSAASELYRRITSTNPDERMPPLDSQRQLTGPQIEQLRNWIDQGAKFESHWAFQPVRKPDVPTVASREWVRNPIDAFVLARLEAERMAPSPPANRTTLIRRVGLDLTGLLPTPEELDDFVNDQRIDAYDRLVDRLLKSVHYGERWGRHWLDQARYADSNGYTIDADRVIWPYRDWVIHALNSDMPFDQFTIEQIAGDLLPEPAVDQLIATGFHRNSLINDEGGTDDEQFRVESVVDRVNTTGAVWLGLTLGCAQCHSHKFDPISQHEYYQMLAFFNSTEDKNNIGPTVIARPAPKPERIAEINRLVAQLQKERAADSAADKATGGSDGASAAGDVESIQWTAIEPTGFEAKHGAEFIRLDDHSVLVGGENKAGEVYRLRYSLPGTATVAIRIDAMTDTTLPRGGPGRAANGNFVMTSVRFSTGDGQPVALSDRIDADYSQPDHDITGIVDDNPATGWAINTNQKGNVEHWAVVVPTVPVAAEVAELALEMTFRANSPAYNLGRFRLSVSDVVPDIASGAEREREKSIRELVAEKKLLESQAVKTMVMRELKQQRPSHVLTRGDFLRPGDPVEPGVLSALHGPPLIDNGRTLNRLDLARWLVDSDNPLTPRVTVNRIWQRYFGRGLVETENDFGTQGTVPSHPDLLDWLAATLVQERWSVKAMHRLIVTSATYRQSSQVRPDLLEQDPQNRLLARQNRLRVEAEIVRDLALCASGRLTRTVGGPSVFPPQPEGLYAFTQRKRAWNTSEGEDRYRRTMYTFFYRSAPHPLLTTFDTPRFNATCTHRVRSNTPLQSLMVANDAGLVELAQALGRRVIAESHSDDYARLTAMFRLCLCREPSPAEADRLLSYMHKQQQQLQSATDAAQAIAGQHAVEGEDPALTAAWTAGARVLLNLDEFITRE